MKIGSSLVVEKKYIDKELLDDNLKLVNPDYASKARFSKNHFYKRDTPQYLFFYKEIGHDYLLPRNYSVDYPPTAFFDFKKEGANAKYKSFISLRDYQDEYLSKFFTEDCADDFILEMPCGTGKTLMGIFISHYYEKATLILVPTIYLANQWRDRIGEFTSASVSIFNSKDVAVTLTDFIICSLDLFVGRKMPEDFINHIGHVILDEAHRLGANTYLPILEQIPAKKRTALTATFRRNDGMHKILSFHFGKVHTMISPYEKAKMFPVSTGVTLDNLISKNKKWEVVVAFFERNGIYYKEFKGVVHYKYDDKYLPLVVKEQATGAINKTNATIVMRLLKNSKELNYTLIESYLTEHSGRMKKMIKVISECLLAGRKVLVISKRKTTLKQLSKYFADYKPMLVIAETNKMSEEDKKYMLGKCPLILGVAQLAKEGLDIPKLDTLVLHLPIKDTEQSVGRISRYDRDKKDPIAFYFVDDFNISRSTFKAAEKFIKINAVLQGYIETSTVKYIV